MIWTLLSFLLEVTCWAEGVFLFATFFRSRMATYFWGFDLLCYAVLAPTYWGTSSWKHSFSSISNSAILFFSQKLSSGSSHMEDSSWMCGVWVDDALSDNTIIAETVSLGFLTTALFSVWADGGPASAITKGKIAGEGSLPSVDLSSCLVEVGSVATARVLVLFAFVFLNSCLLFVASLFDVAFWAPTVVFFSSADFLASFALAEVFGSFFALLSVARSVAG